MSFSKTTANNDSIKRRKTQSISDCFICVEIKILLCENNGKNTRTTLFVLARTSTTLIDIQLEFFHGLCACVCLSVSVCI